MSISSRTTCLPLSSDSREILRVSAENIRRVVSLEQRDSDRAFGLVYRLLQDLIRGDNLEFSMELMKEMVFDDRYKEVDGMV